MAIKSFVFIISILAFSAQSEENMTHNNISGESVVLAKTNPSNLLFDKIISGAVLVRNNYDAKTPNSIIFKEGKDYIIDYKNGTIKRTKNSKIPDYSKHSLYGIKNFDHTKVKNNSNHPFFVWIDYTTENNTDISKPIIYPQNIKSFFDKLNSFKPVKIIVYGDSISTGEEATAPRFTFFDIFKKQLQKQFPKAKINLENGATGGDTTVEGLSRLKQKVLTRKPDIVLVGFGMNDHNINSVSPDNFYKNLKSIVEQIKTNTNAAVILYSTFPPNPEWFGSSHTMENYAKITKKIAAETQSSYADVFSIWKKVLEQKNSSSLLANNINHPNNFGHWIYSQAFVLPH